MRTRLIALAALFALSSLLPVGLALAQDMPANATDTARRALHVCASCHGERGVSKDASYPSLAGQPAQYTSRQLQDFRAQQRAESDARAYMWGVSALLDDATIESLAEYYAAQQPPKGNAAASPAVLARGKTVFEQGLAGTAVRACASCHGEKAEGSAGFPRLAGQHAKYLAAQLNIFSTKLRPHGVLMRDEVVGLSKADREAVAQYLQSM